MFIKRAAKILIKCEIELRQLLSDAASSGAYESVVQLTKLAKEINKMIDPASESMLPEENLNEEKKISTHQKENKEILSKRKKKKIRKKGINSQYPKFFTHKDNLVKVGWSKREKKEYQHKAPRFVIDNFVDMLQNVCKSGKLFSTDDLFPLTDVEQDIEIPSYQAYLCLGWLRNLGFVEQHGRQGYSINNPTKLKSLVNEKWIELPTI